jgi:hypothetical protein
MVNTAQQERPNLRSVRVTQYVELAEVAAAGDLWPLHDSNAVDPVELLWVD